jgi:glycosyltransferase involved in cell wall biosynthesis
MGNGTDQTIKAPSVGIIVEPYEEENASGLSYATLRQAQGLQESFPDRDVIIYTTKRFAKNRLTHAGRWVRVPKSSFGKNAWFVYKALIGSSDAADILLFPMPLLPLVLPGRIRTVPIFYELTFSADNISHFARFKQVLQRFLTTYALRRAAAIIVPSSATRDDVAAVYPEISDKVTVSHLGYRTIGDVQDALADATPFFLYVGRVKFKKNVHTMLQAFCDFKDATKLPHRFLISGKHGGAYTNKLIAYAKERGYGDDVMLMGYLSAQALDTFYRHATALVFCTLQEGFGMPVLEAMSVGTPVVTSNTSSLAEVAGDAALTVAPMDVAAIAAALAHIAQDAALRAALSEKGKKRATLFSWGSHLRDIVAIINRISV